MDTGNIIVVDDEPEVCQLVKRCLQPGGYKVDSAQSGESLKQKLSKGIYDLVILDLNLPGEDGLDLLKEVRQRQNLPVVILSARGASVDRVVGLELGADDYLAKPFEPRELLARVRSVLRRTHHIPDPTDKDTPVTYRFSGWQLNTQTRELLSPENESSAITTAQFDILALLLQHPNTTLSRDRILELARNRLSSPFDRSIDVHVAQLRKKLEHNPKDPQLIKTVHGVGYLFASNVEIS